VGKFILKRVLYGFLVLFGVVTVVFFLFNVLPGDPIRMRMGQHTDQKSIDIIKADLGLDQPLHVQYMMFLILLIAVTTSIRKNTVIRPGS
jgi:peptide/nickel transport system permease protein